MLRAILLGAAGRLVLSAVAGAATTYLGHWLTAQEIGAVAPALAAGAGALYHSVLTSASTPPTAPPTGPQP